jgi:hypothetical protein
VTPQPPRELMVSERPVRSEYATERSYARRRLATIGVLVLVLGGVAYGMLGHRAVNPADIPTIHADGVFKQKPADPGGIDIPHQDVQVYDVLEGRNPLQPQIEHLLPPPEVPQDVPHAAPVTDKPASVQPQTVLQNEPPAAVPPAKDILLSSRAPQLVPIAEGLPPAIPAPPSMMTPGPGEGKIATTATQTPPLVKKTAGQAPMPALPMPVLQAQTATQAPEQLTIERVIEQSTSSSSAQTAQAVSADSIVDPAASTTLSPPSQPAAVASGSAVIQLASSPDKAKAQSMMQTMQHKYADQLGNAHLRLVAANLGSRGIYYRIQSQGLSENEANQICSSLKQMSAGCILVRK